MAKKRIDRTPDPSPEDDYNFRTIEKQRELEAAQKRREEMLTKFRNGRAA